MSVFVIIVSMNLPSLKQIAFYLPQFYPFEENNKFWGEGFTEWTNVKRAKPQFLGHKQPTLPKAGFYDFSDRQVLINQMQVASNYAISAFCIYSYWFSGRRVMTKVFDHLLNSTDTPINFCLCWANESWTKRWDGSESQVLIEQKHDPIFDANFIDDHLEILQHPNYFKVNGLPLLLIYRSDILSDQGQTIRNIRTRARLLGLGELHIAMVQTFGNFDPQPGGFDSAVQFPPHNIQAIGARNVETHNGFQGRIFDYESMILNSVISRQDYRSFPGVMPGWDNTPRRMSSSNIYTGATKDNFIWWLKQQWESAIENGFPTEDVLLFVNAWNEWAEGAQLEPSMDDDFDKLDAILEAYNYALDFCLGRSR